MSDEAYEQRQGTVRQYIKQQKAIHGPNWKPPKMNPVGFYCVAHGRITMAFITLSPEEQWW